MESCILIVLVVDGGYSYELVILVLDIRIYSVVAFFGGFYVLPVIPKYTLNGRDIVVSELASGLHLPGKGLQSFGQASDNDVLTLADFEERIPDIISGDILPNLVIPPDQTAILVSRWITEKAYAVILLIHDWNRVVQFPCSLGNHILEGF